MVRTGGAPSRTVLERRGEADAIVVAPWSAAPRCEYYGADVVDVSTADTIWVITWSETADDISAAERRGLGFGDHVRIEKLQFGRRVSAQLWVRLGLSAQSIRQRTSVRRTRSPSNAVSFFPASRPRAL